MKIVVNLPLPPSVNHIWRGKPGGSYLSRQYVKWKLLAGQEWIAQKHKQPRTIEGPYSAILILVKPDKRRRDVTNFIKVCEDFAVQHGLVEDDSLCEEFTVKWGSKKDAPLGAMLQLSTISGALTDS